MARQDGSAARHCVRASGTVAFAVAAERVAAVARRGKMAAEAAARAASEATDAAQTTAEAASRALEAATLAEASALQTAKAARLAVSLTGLDLEDAGAESALAEANEHLAQHYYSEAVRMVSDEEPPPGEGA
jgi:hypothetical protein